MKRIISIWALTAILLTISFRPSAAAEENPAHRIPKRVSPLPLKRRAAMRLPQGLRGLGYVEGKNIIIEYRYSGGNYDRLASLAAELMLLKPDIIVTGGSPSTRAAKERPTRFRL